MTSRCEDGTVTGEGVKNIQEDLLKSRKVMLKDSLRGKKMQTLKQRPSTT